MSSHDERLSAVKKDYLVNLAKKGKRLDGRGLMNIGP